MGTISSQKQGNKKYYYYYETYRKKIDPYDKGKTRGTGKSKVYTRSTYLGSAENILRAVKENEKNIHQPCIDTGIRKKSIAISLDNPESTAKALLKHADREFISEVGKLLLSMAGEV